MAALMPQGKQQYFTAGGIPLVGGKVYTYAAGTTTPLATYTTAAAGTPNANPVILDSRGEASIFFSAANYKIVVKDSLDSTIWTQDNLPGDQAATIVANLAASTGSSLVGHIASGTGAVASTVQTKLRERVSVKDFGAVGDNVTDCAAAITAAYAEDTTVYYPEGSYRILANVSMTTLSAFAEGAVIVVPTGVTLTISADIDAGEYKIFQVESGGAVVVSTTSTLGQIKGAWFDHTYTGFSIIVRGQLAGHATVGGAGLAGLDYVHIDGYRACEKTPAGLEGMAIGTYAGLAAQSLLYNTLVGYAAGRGKEDPPGTFRNWTGADNTVLGTGSFVNVIAGNSCTAIGSGVMKEFETGDNVTAIGTFAGRLGKNQNNMVHIGNTAGYNVGTTGTAADNADSVHIGFSSGTHITQSKRNTAIGAYSAEWLTTGSNNVSIGYASGTPNGYGASSYSIVIGNNAYARGNNAILIGNGMTAVSDGELRIGDEGTATAAYIAGIDNSTTASAANMVVVSGGRLLRSTSSAEFKTAVEPLEDQWADKVLGLQPIYYKSLCTVDNPAWGWYGFIAEDAAKIDPRFAQWGRKGKTNPDGSFVIDSDTGLVQFEDTVTPNGVAYERLVVPLVQIVKRQQRLIESLEQRLAALESK